MTDDSLDICHIEVQNNARDWRGRESVLNETRPSAPAAASSWAWAHRGEAYDWMDSHGPFFTDGPWD
ncbi:MAG TPA: hypothetical protein VF534_03250 [Paraburkholderia sp.]